MAITKIHPLKFTLNLVIDCIVNGDKTDELILVSTYKCHQETVHTRFLRTDLSFLNNITEKLEDSVTTTDSQMILQSSIRLDILWNTFCIKHWIASIE